MKEDYYKNFISINFYGMQSKVKNPMNSPQWKYKPAEPFSINPEVEALSKLKALKTSMRDPVGD